MNCETDCLDSDPCSAIYELDGLGRLLDLSVPVSGVRDSHLRQAAVQMTGRLPFHTWHTGVGQEMLVPAPSAL